MIVEKQLAQSRLTDTSATSLYSPSGETAIIKSIVICNTTASVDTFSLFLDDNGTTYDQTTALFYTATIQANETIEISTYWPMNNSSGNLAAQSGTGNAITYTVFGAVVT